MKLFYKILFLALSIAIVSCGSDSKDTSPTDPGDGDNPKITSVSKINLSRGELITISGEHFGDNRGDSYVEFNTVKAENYTQWSDGYITVEVPQNAQSGKLSVITGNLRSNAIDYKILTQTNDIQITRINPSIAFAGNEVEITGSGFGSSRGDAYIDFNGGAANSYIEWTESSIVVVVPDSGKSGAVSLIKGDLKSNSVNFTINEKNEVLTMAIIPAGTFEMGRDYDDFEDFYPKHTVSISESFYMSQSEISQKQYSEVMSKANPSRFKNDDSPVEQVTWIQAIDFCNRLSVMEGLQKCYVIDGENISCDFNANGYRLPTEAEWEYACAAGTTGDFGGNGSIDDMGWSRIDGKSEPQAIMQKQANAFGLYDMHGNVAEWVWDYYDWDYYKVSGETNPKGPDNGFERVFRGGSYQDDPESITTYKRGSGNPTQYFFYVGFRVVKRIN